MPRRRRLRSSAHVCAASEGASTKAAADAIAADGADAAATSTAQCVRPRPIFPWRSSPDPLPRLERPAKPRDNAIGADEEDADKSRALLEEFYGSDYFTKGGPLGPGWISPTEPWFRFCLQLNSMHLLGETWLSILMPWTRRDWEDEMTRNFCRAFSCGVQGMAENTYMVSGSEENVAKVEASEQSEERGSFDVDLDVTLDPLPFAQRNREAGQENASHNDASDDIGREEEEYSMLERNLRRLYLGARTHSSSSKVNIVLRTAPHSARLVSMFPVFGLSRALVENHPNLRHTCRNVKREFERKSKKAMLSGKSRLGPIEIGSFLTESLNEILERSAKLSGDGCASITIVAQVSIDCKEIFCVRDVDTDEILQGVGDGRPRDVTHLVRFEMVVRERLVPEDEEDEAWEMEIGRWQITDWDDVLDGNVFFT